MSQQEPRLTAEYSGDEKMQQSYKDGKDIYAFVASVAYDLPYRECLEFYTDDDGKWIFDKDGNRVEYEAGHARRSAAKAIVLGIVYGKGVPAIAEDLGISVKKAQEVYDAVLDSFPGLKNFMESSQKHAKDFGYVETIWGRRRHLPDIQLDEFTFRLKDGDESEFDPLVFEKHVISYEVPERKKQQYLKAIKSITEGKCSWSDKNKRINSLIYSARDEGIIINDNRGLIAQAERQCVNSEIQGSAADLSKLAMIAIENDEIMKQLNFHILIPVHDEILGECPRENAKAASERLAYLMIHAGDGTIDIPMKVDVEVVTHWYGEKVEVA